jgi:DNA repair protein RadD
MIHLRPYQREALDAIYAFWQGGGGNPLIDLATGSGKSLVIAKLCQELLGQWPAMRIGIVAHQKELLSQNTQELIRLWPAAPVGIYSAGLGRRDMRARILVMGIQSVWKKAELLGGFDLLIVDEAHLIPRESETRYGKFIADCLAITPDMRIVGLSATPYRLGSGRLDEGEGRMFDKTVYTYGLADGVRDGYLCPILAPHRAIDLTAQQKMHVRGGEFVDSELEEASLAIIREAAADYATIRRQDRELGLAYCAGVKSAQALADELNRLGEPARAITGGTRDRDQIIESVKRRQSGLRHLIFCQIGTTGLNIPHADLVGMFTSTLSASKYVQIGGRISRLAEGKQFAIFADYGGTVRRLGPLDSVNVRSKSGMAGKAEPSDVRSKECPGCNNEVAIQTRTCPHCGHQWQTDAAPKHETRADGDAVIMASITPPKWLAVTKTTYARHKKPGRPDSLRVTYWCGLQSYDEWVALESEKARGLASSWWRKMAGHHSPTPLTVDEALERLGDLGKPSEIMVKPDGKYWRVVAHRLPARVEVAA